MAAEAPASASRPQRGLVYNVGFFFRLLGQGRMCGQDLDDMFAYETVSRGVDSGPWMGCAGRCRCVWRGGWAGNVLAV